MLLIKYIYGCVCIILATFALHAQNTNSHSLYAYSQSGEIIAHANIIMYTADSALHSYFITDDVGRATIDGQSKQKAKWISINALGYAPVNYHLVTEVLHSGSRIDTIILEETTYELQETVIKAKPPPVYAKKDTIVYNLDQIDIDSRQRLEDYLRELDGFEVTEGGKIKFNGDEIQKILLDHTDLTGSAYQKISKNINADMIRNIEVINNFEENSVKSKYYDSKEIGLNLDLKESVGSLTGDITGRIGNPDRWASGLNALYVSKKFKGLAGARHSRFSESFAQMDIGSDELQNDRFYYNTLSSPNQQFRNSLLMDLPMSYRYDDQQTEFDLNTAFKVKGHKFRFTGNRQSNIIPLDFRNSMMFTSPGDELSFQTITNSHLNARTSTAHFGGEYQWGKNDLEYHRAKFNAIYDQSDIQQFQTTSGDFTDSSGQGLNTQPTGLFLETEHSFSFDEKNALFINTRFKNQNARQSSSVSNTRWGEGLLFADEEGFIQQYKENVSRAAASLRFVNKRGHTIQSHGLIPKWEGRELSLDGRGQKKDTQRQSLPFHYSLFTVDYRYMLSWRVDKKLRPMFSVSTGGSEILLNDIRDRQVNYSAKFSLTYKPAIFKRYSLKFQTERSPLDNIARHYYTYFSGTQKLQYKLEEIRPSTSYSVNFNMGNTPIGRGYEVQFHTYYNYSQNSLMTAVTEDPANTIYQPFYTDMQQWYGGGSAEFIISQLLTKVNLSLSYSGQTGDNLINNTSTKNIHHSFSTKLELRKPLGDKISVALFGEPTYSVFLSSNASPSTNFYFEGGGKITWSPAKAWRAFAYYKVLGGEAVETPFHLLDFALKYYISDAWQLQVDLQNLLDYTSFGRIQDENFYSYSQFVQIPGRAFSVEVSYMF